LLGLELGHSFKMGRTPNEIDEAREKVRRARAAYEEALHSESDPTQTKRLKDELYAAEAELVRVKRASESPPPSHLL
jgi:hypothetical protein